MLPTRPRGWRTAPLACGSAAASIAFASAPKGGGGWGGGAPPLKGGGGGGNGEPGPKQKKLLKVLAVHLAQAFLGLQAL